MRKISMYLDQEWLTKAAETVGHCELYRAIGRLSVWCPDSYPEVKIRMDGDTDLTAVYADAEGNTRYVIGAVWHENADAPNGGAYGFHS